MKQLTEDKLRELLLTMYKRGRAEGTAYMIDARYRMSHAQGSQRVVEEVGTAVDDIETIIAGL